MAEGVCQTCGGPLKEGAGGRFCVRCLYGTALAELAEAPDMATPEWQVMGDYLPEYEFVGEVGRGGMGAVYEAVDPADGERVAVKLLAPASAVNPELVERFRREAEVMQDLRHERIVRVRAWGERNGLLFLVMEHVPGGDLAQLLRKRGPLELDEAVRLADEAAEGLEFSHERGVLHRDLKPGNLLIGDDGRIKVGDFGLAKVIGRESELELTMTHASMGTPRYMAPEQLGGAGEADERSDIYSLGVVFYEMLTGRLPEGSFALPSERAKVGERVDEWVLRALSDNPDERFASVREAREGLAELVRRPSRRGWIVAAVLAAGLLLGIWYWTTRDPGPRAGGSVWRIEAVEGSLPEGFPERVEDARDLRLSDARRPFGVALMADGSLRGFGDDSYGQASPPAGTGFVAVALGRGERAAHGLALRGDGTVAAWGDDSFGQASVPAGLSGVEAVQAGEFWSAARRQGGEVVVWGRDGDVDPESIDWAPQQAGGLRATPDG